MHVLIIEDEALIAMDLELFFTELGADSCALASTETDAISAALAHHPDLITADVQLAEGSGPSAVMAIRKELGDVLVVYITSATEVPSPPNEMTHVLRKPIHWLELVKAVEPHNLPVPDNNSPTSSG